MRSYGLSLLKVCKQSPPCKSHNLIVPSWLPRARRLPFGLKSTARTRLVWPCNVLRHWPVLTSYSRAVWSSLPLARSLPSALKATECTQSVWPYKVRSGTPVGICHNLTSPFAIPAASISPPGLNATERTFPKVSVKAHFAKLAYAKFTSGRATSATRDTGR